MQKGGVHFFEVGLGWYLHKTSFQYATGALPKHRGWVAHVGRNVGTACSDWVVHLLLLQKVLLQVVQT